MKIHKTKEKAFQELRQPWENSHSVMQAILHIFQPNASVDIAPLNCINKYEVLATLVRLVLGVHGCKRVGGEERK